MKKHSRKSGGRQAENSIAARVALVVLLAGNLLGVQGAALAQDGNGLDEVVVTARKRAENLQTTPISITSFSGAALAEQHIDRLDGIASSTPNMTFDTGTTFSGSTSSAAVYIRGIGQLDFTLTSEPGVGIYLDGVYIGTTIGSVLDLVDIDHVEVLRGPQGTLFGRNTIGGAISVTSKLPDDKLHGDFKVTSGAYDRIDVSGNLNVPINDTLFADVSAATFNRDGFVDAPNSPVGGKLGDIDRDSFRGALRFVPNDRFEANFAADYSRQRENGVPNVLIGVFPGASLANIGAQANPASPGFISPPAPLPPPSFVDLHNILATAPVGEQGGIAGLFPGVVPNSVFGEAVIGPGDVIDIDDDNLSNPSAIDLSSDTDIWGVALTMGYQFDGFSLKSISSYRDMEAGTGFDTGALAQTIAHLGGRYDVNQFSQEVQLAGVAFAQRLNWLTGFYYFDEDGLHVDDVEFTPVRILSGAKIKNRSTAGFAQATFDVTPKLSLTAGIRYTDESKKFIVPDHCYDLPSGPETLFDGSVVTCAQLQSVIDPKFANAGFLTFVNAPVFPAPGGRFCCLPVSDADGNIVGLLPGLASGMETLPRGTTRQSFSDWTPLASIAYRWTDDLMTYFSYSEGFKSGGFVQRVFPPRTAPPSFKAETARVFELGAKATAFDNRVRASAAGFHTEYDDMHIQVNDGIAAVTRNAAAAEIDGFELELMAIPATGWLVQGGVGYMDARYSNLEASANLDTDLYVLNEDSKMVNAPEWSTNLGVQYTWPMPRFGGQVVTRLDWAWQSEVFKDALNFPELRQAGYHLLDLAATYYSEDGRWEISAFGKNVTDERYKVSGYANALTIGTAIATVGRPAEWGVSFAYRFGQ
jgi:iron complex outermembrane receptor protein